MSQQQSRKGFDVSGRRIQRGHIIKGLATACQEIRPVAQHDFLERLEAVGGETRTDDSDAPVRPGSELCEDFVRVGLEPCFAADSRLKTDRPFVFLVRDIKTNNILFMGRVLNPAA